MCFSGREHRRDQQRARASVLRVPHGSVPIQLRKRVRDLGEAPLHVGEVGQEPASVFQPALQRPGETHLSSVEDIILIFKAYWSLQSLQLKI